MDAMALDDNESEEPQAAEPVAPTPFPPRLTMQEYEHERATSPDGALFLCRGCDAHVFDATRAGGPTA